MMLPLIESTIKVNLLLRQVLMMNILISWWRVESLTWKRRFNQR
jgi:hypothetical protein